MPSEAVRRIPDPAAKQSAPSTDPAIIEKPEPKMGEKETEELSNSIVLSFYM